jgi:hypothetical protein
MRGMKRNKNILWIALAVGLILLVPLAAMQLTGRVDWSLFDFATGGGLLFGAGISYELVSRMAHSRASGKGGSLAYRAGAAAAIATALLLVWLNLAVGIIGSEDNPANRLYIAVLAVGLGGALLARLRPQGTALAMLAAALVQALVALYALVTQADLNAVQIVLLNGFFIALWAGSALLFRLAARSQPRPAVQG